eukprot:361616-Chlamydomonas_euryale.AAC.9
MGTAFVLNPHKQFQMMSLKATLPDEPAQPPPPDHWDKVVAELDPTQDQVDEILACWDLNGAIMVGHVCITCSICMHGGPARLVSPVQLFQGADAVHAARLIHLSMFDPPEHTVRVAAHPSTPALCAGQMKTEEEAVAARAQLSRAIDMDEVNKWQESVQPA